MKYYGATDIGLIRKVNQDSYIIATSEAGDVFALVCDGIGGGRCGDVASQRAIQYFSEVFSLHQGFESKEEAMSWLRAQIRKANDEIFTLSTTRKAYHGMGTTLVGVLLTSVGSFVCNVGDSRAYALSKAGRFMQLTRDHTLVADMVEQGTLSREEAKRHPRKNVLTNALGVWASLRIDVEWIRDPIKTYLICSDGLHGYLPEGLIEEILKDDKKPPRTKVRQLMHEAIAAGGYDNITMILIEKEEGDRV